MSKIENIKQNNGGIFISNVVINNNVEKTIKIKVTYSSTNEKCIEDVIKNLITSHIDEIDKRESKIV